MCASLSKVNAVYAEYFQQAGPAKLARGVSALYGGANFEIRLLLSSESIVTIL